MEARASRQEGGDLFVAVPDITYFCANPEHRAREDSGLVTYHASAWAYCPDAEAVKDHRWEAIEPRALTSLRFERSRPRQPTK